MDAQLRRYYLAAAGVLVAASATSALWKDVRVTLGVAAGALASVVPFATWHMIVTWAGPRGARWRGLVVGLILAKYALVAVLMWALFRSGWAHEVAFGAGLAAGTLAVIIVAFSGART
jgi:hypothetical protein